MGLEWESSGKQKRPNRYCGACLLSEIQFSRRAGQGALYCGRSSPETTQRPCRTSHYEFGRPHRDRLLSCAAATWPAILMTLRQVMGLTLLRFFRIQADFRDIRCGLPYQWFFDRSWVPPSFFQLQASFRNTEKRFSVLETSKIKSLHVSRAIFHQDSRNDIRASQKLT